MSLKILQIHNRYLVRGGEDTVADQEAQLFRDSGHIVDEFFVDNTVISNLALKKKYDLLFGNPLITSVDSRLNEKIESFKPDIVHVYNTFPLLGFEFITSLTAKKIPVVIAISNYRAGCLNAEYLRSGKICTMCDDFKTTLPGVILKCYHSSFLHSFGAHNFARKFRNFIGTFDEKYVRLTYLNPMQANMLNKFNASRDLLFFKPNFLINDPGFGEHKSNDALFVGRLTESKGIGDILQAWKQIKCRLKVVGADASNWTQDSNKNVEFLGIRDRDDIFELMRNSRFLVFGSKWFEGMPMVLLEALAAGLPIVAPNISSIESIIPIEQVGWKFSHQNPVQSLVEALQLAFTESDEKMRERAQTCRDLFIKRYSMAAQLNFMSRLYSEFGIHYSD